MGTWGWTVVAKGDHTLAGHSAVGGFGDEVDVEYVRGEWRELSLFGVGSGECDIAAVAAATGAPAMAFYVMDDDCAIGEAATPAGRHWSGVFREDVVMGDYADALPAGYRREDAVAGAIAWAAEAGLTPDPIRIERAFAGGWMDDLFEAIGLPAQVARPAAG